jgi:hypothetical protein
MPAPAVPPVATPSPAVTPTPAAATARTVRRDGDVLVPVLLAGVPVALLLSGVLALALLRRSARFGHRAAPAAHAWREAAWRADGRWEDFRDWLRLGR